MGDMKLPARRDVTRRGFLAGGGAALITWTIGACGRSDDEPSGEELPVGEGKEAPMLAERVEAGELPPLEERLPENPLVVEPVEQLGQYGGEWRTAMLGPSDEAWVNRTIGQDNLTSWNREFTEPVFNVAESIDANGDATEYVIKLRRGLKWSDGEPFTAADLMFVYEDVYGNEELYPGGPPSWLHSGGEPAVFEEVDEFTVRVRFAATYPLFLHKMAGVTGGVSDLTTLPRHYLEQFHADYNPDVDALVGEEGFADWVELFGARSARWQNADLPTLCAWMLIEPVGAGSQVVAERNPYYWKTDPEGRQLPYIDRVVYDAVSDEEVMLVKATNGELDMHSRHINFLSNKPVLAEAREDGDYRFFAWGVGHMNEFIIQLNLTHPDPVKRQIFQNKDFRIGLSHAIDRQEMIDTVFQRQGEPWQVALGPESELYDEEMARQYTEFNVDLANQHLDRAGYADRDDEGFRLGPDGNRISVSVSVMLGRDPWWVPCMELVEPYWREVGIDAGMETMDSGLFWERTGANEYDAAIWGGASGGSTMDAMMNPRWYLPAPGLLWAPLWANWYSGSEPAEEPPEGPKRQMELYDELSQTVDENARLELLGEILQIARDEFYTIGTVRPSGGYGIVGNDFHNVFEPMPHGAEYDLGCSGPEQFFIADA